MQIFNIANKGLKTYQKRIKILLFNFNASEYILSDFKVIDYFLCYINTEPGLPSARPDLNQINRMQRYNPHYGQLPSKVVHRAPLQPPPPPHHIHAHDESPKPPRKRARAPQVKVPPPQQQQGINPPVNPKVVSPLYNHPHGIYNPAHRKWCYIGINLCYIKTKMILRFILFKR